MSKKLKLLILSTSHPLKTAGIGAYCFLENFQNLGHDIKLIVKVYDFYKNDNIVNYHSYFESKLFIFLNLIKRFRNKIFRKINVFQSDREYSVQTINQRKKLVRTKRILEKTGFIPDAIFVYFSQQFVNFIDLYLLQKATHAPIFFLLPDMSVFTGLCHYSWDCSNFKNSCGNCPAIFSKITEDVSYLNLKSKLYYSQQMNIIALSWSDWLSERIKVSSIFKNKPLYKIPIIEKKENFFSVSPSEKEKLKKKYNIENNKTIISFGALNLNLKRKGIADIIKAINLIPSDNLNEIVIIYSGLGDLPEKLIPVKTINFGLLNWEMLIEFYQISDIYISASLQDVGPATIIESLLCGVPVITYNTGIAADWVINNYNGYIVNENTYMQLYLGIKSFLNISKDEYNEIRENCIRKAKEYNDDKKYKIIEKILLESI